MSGEVKRPKPARGKSFGILNPYGDLWTYDHFRTEQEAHEHIRTFWRSFPGPARDTSRFKVVPVRVTVSVIRSPATPTGGQDEQ